MALLRRHFCDEIQGFHFSRALPPAELGKLVLDNRAQPSRPAPDDRNVQTMLVVDDDVNMLASLHRLFRRDNYRVLTAATPAEALRAAGAVPRAADPVRPAHAGHERHRVPQQGEGDVSGHDTHHPVRLHRRWKRCSIRSTAAPSTASTRSRGTTRNCATTCGWRSASTGSRTGRTTTARRRATRRSGVNDVAPLCEVIPAAQVQVRAAHRPHPPAANPAPPRCGPPASPPSRTAHPPPGSRRAVAAGAVKHNS